MTCCCTRPQTAAPSWLCRQQHLESARLRLAALEKAMVARERAAGNHRLHMLDLEGGSGGGGWGTAWWDEVRGPLAQPALTGRALLVDHLHSQP
jgi:hypothetical protein